MPNQTAQATQARKADMPLAGMQMDVRNFTRAEGDTATGPAATFELVFSTGAPVRRYDWTNDRYYSEVLSTSPDAIDLSRLERGAPLLNTHSAWSLEDQIGVVDQPAVARGEGTVQAQMSRRESVRGIVMDLEDRVIRNVSVGYVRNAMTMSQDVNGNWTYLVTRWTPMEVSLVPIPADMDSQVRSEGGKLTDAQGREMRSYPCDMHERNSDQSNQSDQSDQTAFTPTVGTSAANSETRKDDSMPQAHNGGAINTPADTAATAASTVAATAAAQAATQAEAARSADITDLCHLHGVSHLTAGMIRSGQTIEQARAAVLTELAVRDAASGGHRNVTSVTTLRDEMDTRMAGMQQAIGARIDSSIKPDDNGRQYRGMTLFEMGREFLEAKGVSTRGLDRMTLATRMLHFRDGGSMGTSDFSSLFANVANKRLRDAYVQSQGTYSQWARRAPNAPDFKNMTVAALSGAPELLQVNEHGEFKVGTMSDGQEAYKVLTYGRIVSLTRQAIINDDLRAFERLVSSFGNSSLRLENRLVYSQLTGNAALADGIALFDADHSNLATGAGSALQVSALQAGRTAMRLQKGTAGEDLNITPAFLIVPVALEQTAYQLTSAAYVAAKQSDINEFQSGGRTAVTPIVEPLLDGISSTAWYMAANSGQIDTVEYCYLDGSEGPMIESEVGFETDGISYKCRLDFASKAIDHRGLYKANGS